ncbi:germination protease [Clostridia bacterium]|nr:germination protease [Clostridia bacterium]
MDSIRTDLAVENYETAEREIDGVSVTVASADFDIKITTVEILDESGETALGKPVGSYITVESTLMKENAPLAHDEIIKVLARELGELHKLPRDATVLVIGLGNRNITADALGPKVTEKTLTTRHINSQLPRELLGKVRAVSAIAPGVMGQTGIETGEVVAGLVSRVNPDLVIAIDALAARRANRINATIQMSDTGLNPGAGVGNKRMAINRETLGVPVIAIGVPTVVDAATLVTDTIDLCLADMIEETEKGSEFYEMLQSLAQEERYHIIKQVLEPYAKNMFVTPKEVDAVIERLAGIVANALNIGLHTGITMEDVNKYSHDLAN